MYEIDDSEGLCQERSVKMVIIVYEDGYCVVIVWIDETVIINLNQIRKQYRFENDVKM